MFSRGSETYFHIKKKTPVDPNLLIKYLKWRHPVSSHSSGIQITFIIFNKKVAPGNFIVHIKVEISDNFV